jgi:hypothetical protein
MTTTITTAAMIFTAVEAFTNFSPYSIRKTAFPKKLLQQSPTPTARIF